PRPRAAPPSRGPRAAPRAGAWTCPPLPWASRPPLASGLAFPDLPAWKREETRAKTAAGSGCSKHGPAGGCRLALRRQLKEDGHHHHAPAVPARSYSEECGAVVGPAGPVESPAEVGCGRGQQGGRKEAPARPLRPGFAFPFFSPEMKWEDICVDVHFLLARSQVVELGKHS
ncbi:uncharacterized protein LOC103252803, partial [Carlito syrichta]|uniref:Uncharacterized protein LOC103252803 n=1 Tax=Carlito syrichta TaxID=1868482 RepID=A0A1U7SZM8_CARSF